ncbi:hypothetical protein [Kitasatospora sp. CB02891]|uniref:hypothetical protein n=1 Tax=Kitasatospora sp. CB02891 TaxID=2020329 RepID=UPI000C27FD6B|nr:hypothetical protein [Kitasatospora sp. CB02891]PJN24076.1 hypothetical protein CG736_19465 [Kitasatospora sp. CB02891]
MPTLATLAARARTLLSTVTLASQGAVSSMITLIEADALRRAASLVRAERRPTGMTRDQAQGWRQARDQIAGALQAESARLAASQVAAGDQHH